MIVDDLRRSVVTLQSGSREELYDIFVQNWQENIRVLLCANPAGDSLRKAVRNHPTLFDCCTFDWYEQKCISNLMLRRFSEWPSLSLKEVALQYISSLPILHVFTVAFLVLLTIFILSGPIGICRSSCGHSPRSS